MLPLRARGAAWLLALTGSLTLALMSGWLLLVPPVAWVAVIAWDARATSDQWRKDVRTASNRTQA